MHRKIFTLRAMVIEIDETVDWDKDGRKRTVPSCRQCADKRSLRVVSGCQVMARISSQAAYASVRPEAGSSSS